MRKQSLALVERIRVRAYYMSQSDPSRDSVSNWLAAETVEEQKLADRRATYGDAPKIALARTRRVGLTSRSHRRAETCTEETSSA